MSRMFEALLKVRGEPAEVALPTIVNAGGAGIYTVERQPAGESPSAVETSVATSAGVVELPVNTDVRVHALDVKPGSPVILLNGVNSPATEQYRIVRTRILQHERKTHILLVSSPCPGDGKTVSAINLAAVLSLRDSNVLLIDADLRRSSIAGTLGLPDTPGLGDVLAGRCPLHEAVIRTEQNPNLYVLTGGESTSNPAELLDSPQWRTLCKMVREHFDFVVMDAPPVAAVADYELLQAACDSVILVIRPDYTEKSMCMNAIALVPEEKLLGTILNCAYDWFLHKTHNSYYSYGKHEVFQNAKG